MTDTDALARMANQIARNFAVQGREHAISATAEHITAFWDPRMRAKAFGMVAETPEVFGEEARCALERLRDG